MPRRNGKKKACESEAGMETQEKDRRINEVALRTRNPSLREVRQGSSEHFDDLTVDVEPCFTDSGSSAPTIWTAFCVMVYVGR